MSMFSMASSKVQPGLATVASKGYKLTMSKSMVWMPCSFKAAMCSGTSRRANKPPCTLGCKVFTRPSNISGNSVTWATSVTGRPCSANNLAVPPVDTNSTFSACNALASSTMPVLSETEINAFILFISIVCVRSVSCAKCCGSSPATPQRAIGFGLLVA